MIWVAGSSGLLGTELVRLLRERGQSYLGTGREVDIVEYEAVARFVNGKDIHAIINCAGYTAVDSAEDEVALSLAVNATGAQNLALVAHEINAQFIHISTDYVFNGQKGTAYTEEDPVDPLSAYGRSKAEGERLIIEANTEAIIVRTSWLYGAYGESFVSVMRRLMSERDCIRVVNDQFGSPTWSRDLASAIAEIENTSVQEAIKPGIYHYAGMGMTSWYEFALEIQRLLRFYRIVSNDCRLEAISSDQYGAKAQRPSYSVLDTAKVRTVGLACWPWKERLEAFFKASYGPKDI